MVFPCAIVFLHRKTWKAVKTGITTNLKCNLKQKKKNQKRNEMSRQ